MDAGRLDSRVKFQRQIPGADDGYGNTLPASWSDVVTVWASFRPQFGSEKVEAGVLESTLRGVLMVRRSTATEGVTPADRAAFVSGHFAGRAFQIRSISPTMDGVGLEMTIEHNVAEAPLFNYSKIVTEAGAPIVTEAGANIITEAA